jgi:hypothetical protein
MHPTRPKPGLRHQPTPCAQTQMSTLLVCSVWGGGGFLGAMVSTDLPLMQARVLKLYKRARGAGRFDNWQREREIVAG